MDRIQMLRITLVAAITLCSTHGFGQSLDSSFATNGFTQDQSSVGHGKAIVVQPDDKIVVANQRQAYYGGATGVPDFYLYCIRYHQDGSIDSAFGQNGVGRIPHYGDAEVRDMDIQSDGKLLLAGEATYCGNIICGFYNISLGRLNSDGSVDTTFGNNGILNAEDMLGPMYLNSSIRSVKALSSGKILVSGFGLISTDGTTFNYTPKIFVARLNSDGSYDTSFGPDNTGMYLASQYSSIESEMLVAPDNSIYWLTTNGNNAITIVLKLTPDGLLDTNYATAGAHTVDIGTSTNTFVSMDLRDDGKLVLGGYIYENSAYSSIVVTLNSDGSMFSQASESFIDMPMDNGRINSIKCDSGNRVLISGFLICDTTSYNNPARLGFVGLIKEDGSYDTTFSDDGIMTFELAPSGNWNRTLIEDMYVLDNGDILCTGGRLATVGSTKSQLLLFKMNFERSAYDDDDDDDDDDGDDGDDDDDGVYVADLRASKSEIQVFPNPAAEYIEVSDLKNFDEVRILDSKGNLVSTHQGATNWIPVSNLSEGIYFLHFIKNQESFYSRFVKN